MALPARAAGLEVLALGDSLTAGYGLDKGLSFPDQLSRALSEIGTNASIINGGVSGDTSAGGRARLGWLLNPQPGPRPDAVIVELGANDGLRGLDPAETRANLDAILARLGAEKIPVLLTGMLAPPNLGRDYGAEFNSIYPDLAKKYGVLYYPFFLNGVATMPELNQKDGIHPNEQGVGVIVEKMLPTVQQLLERARHAKLAQ